MKKRRRFVTHVEVIGNGPASPGFIGKTKPARDAWVNGSVSKLNLTETTNSGCKGWMANPKRS